MSSLEQLLDSMGLTPAQAALSVLGLIGVLAAVIALRLLRRPAPVAAPEPDRSIDVAALGEQGPPEAGPRLELYHMPMRLAALIVAPTGRGSPPPDEEQIAALADQILPGLAAVVEAQRPVVRVWPAQLSSQGFANTFFTHTRLPGDKGKGTPWCAVAGRFEAAGQKFLAGLVLRGVANSNLSTVVVEREAQWLDLMRVRLTRDA